MAWAPRWSSFSELHTAASLAFQHDMLGGCGSCRLSLWNHIKINTLLRVIPSLTNLFRHSISPSFWHIFWHSISHVFWHIFWHSISRGKTSENLRFTGDNVNCHKRPAKKEVATVHACVCESIRMVQWLSHEYLTFFLAFYLASFLPFFLTFFLALCLTYVLIPHSTASLAV